MKSLLLSVTLAGNLMLPLVVGTLPAQKWEYNQANGHVYTLTPNMTWHQAEDRANSLGGHLVTVRNQAEQSWLLSTFGNQSLWIGLTDEAVEGTFLWSSGEPVSYTNWAIGEPNGLVDADFVLSGGNGWDDVVGGQMSQGIIEVSDLAGYTAFGTGCPGSIGVPVLGAAPGSLPRTDEMFALQLDNLPGGNVSVVFGFSSSDWAGIPLPLDLTQFGLPGCTLHASVDVALPLMTSPGSWQLTLQISNDPSLIGLHFFNQALVLDPGVNSFLGGAVMTNAAEGVIGAPPFFSTGSGPALVSPLGIAVDGNRALVVDASLQAVLTVSLMTGDRAVLSDATTGTGPPILRPSSIAVDGNRALVVDTVLGSVIAVDLLTGNRTVVSGLATGTGAPFNLPVGIAVDGNRALIAEPLLSAVVAVDLATGNRTVLADANTGMPPPSPFPGFPSDDLENPLGIVVDGSRALVLDSRADKVFAVDLATGDRTVLSENTFVPMGGQPDFGYAVAIALDGTRALVSDTSNLGILTVDLMTGDRTLLSDPNTGMGPNLILPLGITVDGTRALVTDFGLSAVVAVDLQSGDRVILSK